MGPRTRSTTSSPVKKVSVASAMSTESKHDPVKVLIAPHDVSENARFLSLRQPGNATPKRFLFCPQSGLLELKRTAMPSNDPRSIIFAPARSDEHSAVGPSLSEAGSFEDGYVSKDAEILIATPYDIAFVLLPSVALHTTVNKKALFQPIEDILSSPESNDKALRFIVGNAPGLVRDAMLSICDTVDAGDETMFRYSEEKLLKHVMEKAQRVAKSGLPASIEERFVTRVLEAPMMSIKREESSISATPPQHNVTGEAISQCDTSFDSQSMSTGTTTSAVFSQASTTTTISNLPEDIIPINIEHLQRLRTAFNFIAASCLPSYIVARLAIKLSEGVSSIDFQPLDEHLKQLAVLRVEAAASRSMSDFSRKRGLDDEEAAEEKAEKKRKQEEDEKKKKANESRGVRDLKKVNVTGMKKMSDFFGKKPAAVKVKP